MSFLAIPAVPYIITGSMSLYLSYKTYTNYYQNVDFIELERDNKIKNQEELEQKIKSESNLSSSESSIKFDTTNSINNIDIDNQITNSEINSENDNKFVSIDEEQNVSIEKIEEEKVRPPTPYPHEEINKVESNSENEPLSEARPLTPVKETLPEKIANELVSDVINKVVQEPEVASVAVAVAEEPVKELELELEEEPNAELEVAHTNKSNNSEKKKKKRKRKNKRK